MQSAIEAVCYRKMMRSKNSGKAKEVVRLKSKDIGAPLNFSHVVHVAPRPLVSVNLEDPHIQAFLKQAGVTEDQLSNLAVYETIVNFIQVHGVENVKKEVDEAASDVVDAPEDNKSGARQQEVEGENTRQDASPSFLSRLLFRGRKKSNVERAGVVVDESKEEIREAASHRIEVETVEAVEKEIDEGEKLLEHGEEEFGEVKKRKKRFSFMKKDADATQEEQKSEESKGSFFSRHWGKNKQQDADEMKKRKAEEVPPAEPKKSAGIFKLNLKKTRASSSSSSASDNEEAINLKPDGDEDEIRVEPAAKQQKKQLTFFKSKTKRSASADELQQFDKVPDEEDKDASSDDEGKKKHVKRDFFKFKSKKAVAVEVHQESAVVVQEEPADHHEIVVHQSSEEGDEKEPDYAQVQKTSKLFGFGKGPKNKKEPAPETEKEYDKLENEAEEKFDEVFKKEAENASKLNIIPSLSKKESSKRKKKNSDASKKDKRSSLEKTSTGSGFFSFGSSKQKKEPADQTKVPEAPRSSLPEENKQKLRKYKVKRLAEISSASLQSAGDASSSDEQEGAKQSKRSRKQRKTSKAETDKKQQASSDEEQIGMFKRIFSRRSASESRISKKEKEKKRRSSVDAVLVTKVAESLQTEPAETVVAEEKAIVDPIYENFPPKIEPDKSTDEEADEYFAQYHQELRDITHTRRSWSFVMAELKEKITSTEENLTEEPQLVFQMRTIEDEENQTQVPHFKPDRRSSSSSSSEDPLEQIKRSVEKLDEEFSRNAKDGVAALQQQVEPDEDPGFKIRSSLKRPHPRTRAAGRTSPYQPGQEQRTISDSIEPDSLEAKTYSDSVQSPLSRVSSISQDSLDSNQEKNDNEGDVTLRSSSGKTPLRQSSSLLSNSESRPLSDCHLKLADNTISLSDELPQITEVVVKSGSPLKRSSRVSKRPSSSMSSSNEDSSSLPTSPVQKVPVLEPVIQKEEEEAAIDIIIQLFLLLLFKGGQHPFVHGGPGADQAGQ
ncbi:Hypothetical predicted protein [Cloeon dipterum]|uniref:CRIB domain-containing protein n=1 Tax=Cloeon dipterum TaxID=197152 RepID=A0A8S1BXE3_9INSE|nr:Hypothetical predicted protein [Cloeon dipterum]